MTLFRLSTLTLSISLILSGCGSSSNDQSSTTVAPVYPTTTSLTGVVADGLIKGATVCLDKNNNLMCDNSEPQSITNDKGEYTLKEISNNDSLNYLVIAVVPKGAIDQDAPNTPISTAYTLTAPIGKNSFISPLTTLVATEMFNNPQLHAEEAAENINSTLGLNIQPSSLFSNYMISSALNIALHTKAKELLTEYINFSAAIKSLPNYTNSDLKFAHHLAVAKVVRNPEQKRLDNPSQLVSNPELELARKMYNNIALFDLFKDNQYIHQLITRIDNCTSQTNVCPPYHSSLITQRSSASQNRYETYRTATQTTTEIPETTPLADLKTLADTGWVSNNTVKNTLFNNTIREIDVSGLPVKTTLLFEKYPTNKIATSNINNSTFNTGAKIFLNRARTSEIAYQLLDTQPLDGSFTPSVMVNIQQVAYPRVSNFISDCVQRYCHLFNQTTASETRLIFAKLLNDGTLDVLSENQQNSNDSTIAAKGTWNLQTVKGQNILTFNLHNSINVFVPNTLFLTEYNNMVVRGIITPSNTLVERYLLNQIAFDNFKAALQ